MDSAFGLLPCLNDPGSFQPSQNFTMLWGFFGAAYGLGAEDCEHVAWSENAPAFPTLPSFMVVAAASYRK
jgi:hypothetical protein